MLTFFAYLFRQQTCLKGFIKLLKFYLAFSKPVVVIRPDFNKPCFCNSTQNNPKFLIKLIVFSYILPDSYMF